MFEKASRMKLRFETPKGLLTVEDLWDIPLTRGKTNLDDIAKELYKKLNNEDVGSFVLKTKKPDKITQVSFDIVTHIIHVRLEEAEKVKQAYIAKEKKAKLLEIIARKEDSALEGMDLEDLKKMVSEL